MRYILFFFFSSRRRHTRSLCDWSSDVCSSDLPCWVRPSTRSLRGLSSTAAFTSLPTAICHARPFSAESHTRSLTCTITSEESRSERTTPSISIPPFWPPSLHHPAFGPDLCAKDTARLAPPPQSPACS